MSTTVPWLGSLSLKHRAELRLFCDEILSGFEVENPDTIEFEDGDGPYHAILALLHNLETSEKQAKEFEEKAWMYDELSK